jgi:hypothetical protein
MATPRASRAPAVAENTPREPEPPRVPLREAAQAPPIDPAAFQQMLAFIRAKPEELQWASIPWQTDLWAARRLALEAGKPIFMWAMNGNPLGCV